MAMNIKNPRVHDLARQAAALTGASQTSALETALEQYLARLEAPDETATRRLARARVLAAQIRDSLTDEDRDAIRRHLANMYDEDGLPA